MPSPVTAIPSPHTNVSNGEGAVQSPDVSTVVDGPQSDVGHSVQEKKQAAKAVLAESGVSVQREGSTPNGALVRHKRSRSGTPVLSSAQKKEQERDERQLSLILWRDNWGAVAMLDVKDGNRKSGYQYEVRDELNQEIAFWKEQVAPVRHRDPGAVFGYGYLGYGNGLTDVKRGAGVALLYPMMGKRPGNRRSRQIRIQKKDRLAQAEQLDDLIPIRLDIELDKIKLRDTFTWNLHDRVIPTDVFAETLVEDFQLPQEMRPHLIQHINREIQEQINDFYPHAIIEDESLDPHLPYSAYKNDEMRILIKLNITIGQHTLVDQFEWDVNDPQNSPEEFARQMACDMSLSGEFTTAIAHSIREQCQMFTKSLYITGHPFDGRPVEDADIQDNFLPSPLPSVFRPMQSAKDYTPYLYELSEQELERAELSILREQRRQKRSVNRRGGPALPDLKDRQRTVRTLVVSSVLPGAAESIEESHLFKVSRTSKRRPGRTDGGGSSDESDSDESVMESPAPSQMTGGTARTRGMRGAATAAQVAMRNAMGRSATPEVAAIQHHETTRRSDRSLRYEAREESVSEPTTLIVKLKISPKRFREYLQNPRPQAQRLSSTPSMALTPPPARQTPGTSMPPPPSPAMPPRSAPANGAPSVEASPKPTSTPTPARQPQQQQQTQQQQTQPQQQWTYASDGRTDAPYPLPAGFTGAPPPPWLLNAVQELRDKYPNDLFEAFMRYNIIDQSSGATVKGEQLKSNAPLPDTYKAQYLPRIRCIDCPGKLYTAGPGPTVENFEVHLKNRQHKTNVERRTGRSGTATSQ